jgi:hypothetical protein
MLDESLSIQGPLFTVMTSTLASLRFRLSSAGDEDPIIEMLIVLSMVIWAKELNPNFEAFGTGRANPSTLAWLLAHTG